MKGIVIFAIVAILILLLTGVWYVWATPTTSTPSTPVPTPIPIPLPPVPANPFDVEDLVKYEWQPYDAAVDICTPSTGKSIAYGIVKKVDGDKVFVRWMYVRNPYPRAGLTADACCWSRSSGLAPNEIAWNMTYWGDENTDPTYHHGLKSIFTSYKDLQKIDSVFFPEAALCRPA